MAPPQGICRRKGTTNHGTKYEQNIAALLGVRCVLREDVEDMWMATNIEGLGAFDDVVLFVQKKEENCSSKEVYLIQIKYKKNGKLNLTAGDNDLTIYQKSFSHIREDYSNGSSPLVSCCKFEDIKFVLFTNTQIDTSNINTHKCSTDNFLNTGKIFQISQDNSTVYDSDFLKQTYFYYKQIDVSKVTNIIKKETDKYFTNCNVKAITEFFDHWHSEQFENKVALEKENIQSLILQVVLSNYIPEPTMEEFIKADIWNEIAKQFKFIFVRYEDYLAKLWQGVKLQLCNFFDDQNIDLLNWDAPLIQASDKINKIKQCSLKIYPTIRKDKNSYNYKDLYLLLWQISKLPLILNLSTINAQRDIQSALSKLDPPHSSGRRYIFLGEATSDFQQHSAQFKFFDIDKNTREQFLKNACVSLQGKEAVTLKELKLSDEVLEEISPELLIHLLQPITKKVDSDPNYLPRLIQQPAVAPNVLTIQNAVFVIVVSDTVNYSTLNRFGIVVPWPIYKMQTNKLIPLIVPENFNPQWINIIILNDIVNLKEYKHMEDVIKEVRNCEEQTIHYLQYLEENKLKWLHSNRNGNQIKPFLIFNSSDASDLPDSELFPYLTFNILSGKAGEGKSTLLHFVANNSPTNVWRIELKMRDINEYTEKGEFSYIISFLFNQSNEKNDRFKNFSKALFQCLRKDRNMLLVIDGIDEVEYNSNINTFLITVRSLGIKILIATRPSLKDTLEEEFDMPLLSLKPLTDRDCESLIKLTLRSNSEELSETDIDTILQKISTWSNIVGVPLLLKLFVTLRNDRILQDFSEFDIIDLFDSFINAQLKQVASCTKSTIRTLSRSALFVLYKEDAVSQIVNIEEYLEDMDDKIEIFINSEIIEKLDKNKNPIFAHKSLAEFLVAKYLFRRAESNNIPYKFLISMFYKELETVRFFFDMIALKGSEFQDVIIGNNTTDLCNIISNDFVDKFGRNILHIAATYGNRCELRTMQSLWSGVRIYESYNNVQDNIIAPCHKFVRRTIVPMGFVCELLQQNLDPHKTDNLFKMDVFDFAIESGSLEIIETLFSRKRVKELGNVDKEVFLFNVVSGGYINIFRELRNKNFNLKILPDMDNLLHIALSSEKLEMIKELSNGVIPINERNTFGYTPLVSWLTLSKLGSKHYSMNMNMKRSSPLDDNQLANGFGETPLHAFCRDQDEPVIKKLIENGADVNRGTKLGDRPLHYASGYSMQNVKLLVKHNAVVDIPNNAGYTPIYNAILSNKIDILRYLIKKGANVNINKNEQSPLNLAISRGHENCAKLLLEKHAKINQSKTNNTLEFAILSGDLDCIKLLLKHGAQLNKDLLHLSVSLNRQQIIEYFLSEKLINIAKININKLLYEAIPNNDTSLIDILISHGADVNANNGPSQETPLHLACRLGLKKTVELLIKNKSTVNVNDKFGVTPLIYAVRLDNIQIIKILINEISDLQKHGSDALCEAIILDNSEIFDYLISVAVNINATNSRGYAAIHAAAGTNIYWVRKLKRMSADLNLKSVNEGITPLMTAVLKGLQDVAEYLIENGAKINEESSSNHHTALAMASQKGQLKCVKFLIDKGSDLQKYGSLAIYMAARHHHITIIDCLISAGADVNGIVDNNKAPIHAAISERDGRVMEHLLNNGANINIKTILEGYTPLMIASSEGRLDVIEYLIANGAKINEETISCRTALTLASQEGHLDCVKFLIARGSDLHKYGPLAIYVATLKDHMTMIDYLILARVDINGTVDNNITPVHVATLQSNIKVIECLLNKGADVNIKTSLESDTPLIIAVKKGNKNVVEYLIEKGAEINHMNRQWHTALICACIKGNLECVKILIDKGSDLSKDGLFALYVAAFNGHLTIVNFLTLHIST